MEPQSAVLGKRSRDEGDETYGNDDPIQRKEGAAVDEPHTCPIESKENATA